jgi:tRNA modification GTPase
MTTGVLETTDTIAAIATPPGRGGVCVLRISGPDAGAVGRAVAGRLPPARTAVLRRFRDEAGRVIDEGLVLFFPAPRSFTGEDVVELHGHGGPVVADLLLRRLLALGARLARPGEFSQRAFVNGRLDLAQAEAVADLVNSGTAAAARAAARSLTGEFSGRIGRLVEDLTGLRVYVEAALDFPDEDIDFLADEALRERVRALGRELDSLRAAAGQGAVLRDGMTVVLAGRPNAGKSSLMNRLTGEDTAIVTHLPGTTRDVLRQEIELDGLPLHVIDTAGLRSDADLVEEEGIRRARREMAMADRVLLVLDAAAADRPEDHQAGLPAGVPVTILRNKIDLLGESPTLEEQGGRAVIALSALTGEGVPLLRRHLQDCVGFRVDAPGALSARRRHLDAIDRARAHVDTGWRQLVDADAGELLAEELRLAQDALGEITGAVSSEALLGKIFASFCIGK